MNRNHAAGNSQHGTEPENTTHTLESHGAFLLPYLEPGQRVLDCGCGMGTITLELADVVFPGRATGIDPNQVDQAERLAFGREMVNADFHTANIYQLPFGDNTFDVVYSRALFERLEHPLSALAELRRVLRTGGILAIASMGYETGTLLNLWMAAADLEMLDANCWVETLTNPQTIGKHLSDQLTPSCYSIQETIPTTHERQSWSYAVSRKPLLVN